MVGAGGWGRGDTELVFDGDRVSVSQDEQVLEVDSGEGGTTM